MKFQKGRIYSDRVDQWLPGAKGREEEINCITGLLKDNFQKKENHDSLRDTKANS